MTAVEAGPADLRAPALGVVAWLAAAGGLLGPAWLVLLVVPAGLVVAHRARTGQRWVLAACWLVAAAAVFAGAALEAAAVGRSPLQALASEHAAVRVTAVVRSAPRELAGRFSERVLFTAEVRELEVRGHRLRMRTPVLVISPDVDLPRGTRVRLAGTLQPADGDDLAAVLTARGPPDVVAGPGAVAAAAEAVRASIRESVAGQGPGPSALVPALVDGDDGGLPDQVVAEFQVAGLTHLLAVSGTNLTLIVGGLLVLARSVGVRARGLPVLGAAGVLGFVLLAGPEPSVLRAAAMGSIALLGLGSGGRRRGLHWLGIAVLVLLLLEPRLALSAGFALSVVATGGILLLAPGWRAALSRWLPLWVADAVAVPTAAQLVCTPLVAAISGQVSLVAIGANLAAGPLVGPTTVCGLAGGLVGLLVPPVGRLVAAPAGWGAAGIIAVAHAAAGLPVPAVGWARSGVALVVLTVACAVAAVALGRVLARRRWALCLAALVVAAVLFPLPTPGWPPRGWVLVACAIGQGDALVLATGSHEAVVVDAGPDPALVDRCLRRLEVRRVPVVVLTHFHADHVDGLSGVLRHRSVGEVVTSPTADPASGVRLVQAAAGGAGIPVRAAATGETSTVGDVRWQVLAPTEPTYPDSASPPNDASLVLLVETAGIRILLMGDEERPSQAALRRSWSAPAADVLKVAHHGSSKQDPDLVSSLGARLAVISVGADNDYGHPARSTLDLLARSGIRVRRTDLDGDVAVVVTGSGGLATVVRGVGPTVGAP